jgi:hypothetical protein
MKDYDEVIETYRLIILDAPEEYLVFDNGKWQSEKELKNKLNALNQSNVDFIILHKISYFNDGCFVRSKNRVMDTPIF